MRQTGVSAAILAGGRNTRMKKAHKAFLAVNGGPIIGRTLEGLHRMFPEVLVIANDRERYGGLDARVIPDVIPHQGPLSGIHTALTHAKNDYVFVVACDMPFVDPDVAAYLAARRAGFDCVVPVIRSYPEPLYAVYGKACLEPVTNLLMSGRRRVSDLFSMVRVNYIAEKEISDLGEPGRIFFNINYPEDWALARDIIKDRHEPSHKVLDRNIPPIVCVVGTSDSGKTMLVARLVTELKNRGFTVGTVKHAPHGADVDVPGKDSWQHARAGAEYSAVVAPDRMAFFRAVEVEPPLEQVVSLFTGADVAVVEGYKYLAHPKILVSAGGPFTGSAAEVFAVAGTAPPGVDAPVFDRDDAEGLARALIDRLSLGGR